MNNFDMEFDDYIKYFVLEKNNLLNNLISKKLEKESIIESLQKDLINFKEFNQICKIIISEIREAGIEYYIIPDYEVENYISDKFPTISSEFKLLLTNNQSIQLSRSHYQARKKAEDKIENELKLKTDIENEINNINRFGDVLYAKHLKHAYLDIVQGDSYFGDDPDDFEIKEVEISFGGIIIPPKVKYPRFLEKNEILYPFYNKIKSKVDWFCSQITHTIKGQTFIDFTRDIFKG